MAATFSLNLYSPGKTKRELLRTTGTTTTARTSRLFYDDPPAEEDPHYNNLNPQEDPLPPPVDPDEEDLEFSDANGSIGAAVDHLIVRVDDLLERNPASRTRESVRRALRSVPVGPRASFARSPINKASVTSASATRGRSGRVSGRVEGRDLPPDSSPSPPRNSLYSDVLRTWNDRLATRKPSSIEDKLCSKDTIPPGDGVVASSQRGRGGLPRGRLTDHGFEEIHFVDEEMGEDELPAREGFVRRSGGRGRPPSDVELFARRSTPRERRRVVPAPQRGRSSPAKGAGGNLAEDPAEDVDPRYEFVDPDTSRTDSEALKRNAAPFRKKPSARGRRRTSADEEPISLSSDRALQAYARRLHHSANLNRQIRSERSVSSGGSPDKRQLSFMSASSNQSAKNRIPLRDVPSRVSSISSRSSWMGRPPGQQQILKSSVRTNSSTINPRDPGRVPSVTRPNLRNSARSDRSELVPSGRSVRPGTEAEPTGDHGYNLPRWGATVPKNVVPFPQGDAKNEPEQPTTNGGTSTQQLHGDNSYAVTK